jgi:IS30 family transposase
MPFGSGESNVRARLSESDIGNIFILRDDGKGVREIARIVGVAPSTISRILNGKTWRYRHGEKESEGIRGSEVGTGAS